MKKEGKKSPEVNKVETTNPPITEAQMKHQQKVMQQRAAEELKAYKEQLRKSNELKELQVRELELNIKYYNNKKEWMDLAPKLEALEEKEKAMQREVAEKRAKKLEELKADQESRLKEEEDKPKIIVPKTGTPRGK